MASLEYEAHAPSNLHKFDSGATRTASKERFDLIPPAALRALATRYGVGAVLHGEDNWLKGIPFSAMIYHLAAHLEKFKEGRVEKRDDAFGEDGDIENLAAIMWGAAGLIHYITEGRTDLDDRKYKRPCPTARSISELIVERRRTTRGDV